MADITTFYPGGAANAAIPHATEANVVDDQNNAVSLQLWTGTQAQYNALATTASPPGPGYDANTIYYTT